MDKAAVFELCKRNRIEGVSPVTVLALIEQESSYNEDAVRLEQGYYSRYIKKLNHSTVVESLLSCSYGLTQMMGQSLAESGFFQWHFSQMGANTHFVDPMQNLHVAYALDQFCENPEWQVRFGTKWLERKIELAGNDVQKGLLYWNGGGDPDYPNKIQRRFQRLTKEGFH